MARPVRWLLICLTGTLVLLGATWWFVHHRARQQIETSNQVANQKTAALQAVPIERPTLGPPKDVDAWVLYDRVRPYIQALTEDEERILDHLSSVTFHWGEHTPRQEDVEALLVKTEPWIAELEPVVRAQRLSDRTVQRTTPPGWDIQAVADLQEWSRLLSTHIHVLRQRGELERALDLAVLQWFIGLDSARRATMVGLLVGRGLASVGVSNVQSILTDFEIPTARLDRLAEEVRLLTASPPSVDETLRVEELYLRQLLADPESAMEDMSDLQEEVGLQYFYSVKVMCADALEQLGPRYDEFREVLQRGTTGKQREKDAEAFSEALEGDPNPVLRAVFATLSLVSGREAEQRMREHLIRVAVACLRYERQQQTWPEDLEAVVAAGLLPDVPVSPYSGMPYRTRPRRVWAVGGDLDDDGGAIKPEEDEIDADGDEVLILYDPTFRVFPWEPSVSETIRKVVDLHVGVVVYKGQWDDEIRDSLHEWGTDTVGRYISEFKALDEAGAFDTLEGRTKVGRLDRLLRSFDGVMERKWGSMKPIHADMTPDEARRIAKRWANWWQAGSWARETHEVWVPDVDAPLEEDGDDEDGE